MTDCAICPDCRHWHDGACPDHQWTQVCPYEGKDCPPGWERTIRLAQLTAPGSVAPPIVHAPSRSRYGA